MSKKLLSLLLALLMVCSLGAPALAEEPTVAPAGNDWQNGTAVSYKGTADEEYFLIVPTTMAPGGTDTVTLKGTWASNRQMTATADASVTMTDNLGTTQTLAVTFPGITLAGNNEAAVSKDESISVGDITALFGEWSGTFYYNVQPGDVDPYAGYEPFTVTKENRAAIGYTGESDEELVIPATFVGDGENGTTAGTNYKVTAIGNSAFYYASELKSVVIPDTVTSLEKSAFASCSSLVSVKLSKNLKSIESMALSACYNLETIEIYSAIETIASDAFNGHCTDNGGLVINIHKAEGSVANSPWGYAAGGHAATINWLGEDSSSGEDDGDNDSTYDSVFANNSWEAIATACQNDEVPESWAVGDTKAMTIDGKEYKMRIVGKNHDDYTDGSGKAPLTIGLAECYDLGVMNDTKTNVGGWKESQMRTVTLPVILEKMPAEVQSAIKAVDKVGGVGGGSEDGETVSDKLFLFAAKEVGVDPGIAIETDGTTYEIFSSGLANCYMPVLDGYSGATQWWFTRSPITIAGNSQGFYAVSDGTSGLQYANTQLGIVFGFCF